MSARALPDWPRMLRRTLAAAYVDLPVTDFEKAISRGTLPGPVMLGDKELWSRIALDDALDRLAGVGVPDFRRKAPFYARQAQG